MPLAVYGGRRDILQSVAERKRARRARPAAERILTTFKLPLTTQQAE